MSKVLFTKKHIIISVVIIFVFLLFISTFWVIGIGPKRVKVEALKTQITKLKDELAVENATLSEIKNSPNLLEAAAVKELPIFPNGIQLEDYFKNLEYLDTSANVTIEKMEFEDILIFPESEDDLGTGAQNQLRSKRISFEIVAANENELLTIIEKLENDNRFTMIEQVSYRCNSASVDEGNFAYSASVVLQMYYLSYYETGKAIE